MSESLASETPRSTAGRSALMVIAAILVAGAANTVVALAAKAAGASPQLMALTPPVYLVLGAVGILVAYLGWRIVRRASRRPDRVLRVLVPVLVVLSWIPDLLVATSHALPGITTTGVVGLMLMHVITASVAVPVFARIAPVDPVATAG